MCLCPWLQNSWSTTTSACRWTPARLGPSPRSATRSPRRCTTRWVAAGGTRTLPHPGPAGCCSRGHSASGVLGLGWVLRGPTSPIAVSHGRRSANVVWVGCWVLRGLTSPNAVTVHQGTGTAQGPGRQGCEVLRCRHPHLTESQAFVCKPRAGQGLTRILAPPSSDIRGGLAGSTGLCNGQVRPPAIPCSLLTRERSWYPSLYLSYPHACSHT